MIAHVAQGSLLQFKCSNSVEPAFAPFRRPPPFCQNSEDHVRVSKVGAPLKEKNID